MTDLEFTHGWTKNLLSVMEQTAGEAPDACELMRRCSSYCYKGKHIADMVESISSIEEFIRCLKNDFGWELSYDKETGVLICNENSTECICPLVRAAGGDISGMICYCTEGMIKTIFEVGLKRKVHTETACSIVRDGKSCVYKVYLENLTEDEKNAFAEASD
ncbi:MAG: hypothetical protein Q4F41_01865 [Eubacteriales bacterium]|nr:hypothetical protein [Eubacteriales bacterium]